MDNTRDHGWRTLDPYGHYATKWGRRPSETCNGVILAVDTAACEEQPQPVVAESAADALDLFDPKVAALGAGVGHAAGDVERQDLVAPAVQGAHQPAALGRVDGRGPGVDEVEHVAGTVDAVGVSQPTDELFELPRGGDLPVGIARAQPDGEPLPAAGVEALGGHHQQLADPVQRVGLAAAVAQRGLLARIIRTS